MQNKNSFSCHHDEIRFCQYFGNQSGWLGEVSLHEQCRVDFTKMHPQIRGHPNPCSCVGLSCSIFKNTSATCAYPLVSNARKLKRDKRAHACAQGTFSYTPCSRRSITNNICFSANIYTAPEGLGTFFRVYLTNQLCGIKCRLL